jgi:hypothetical protein
MRTTFGSIGAEYIQYVVSYFNTTTFADVVNRYLTLILSITPSFPSDMEPWDPPFLPLIFSGRNRLKALLIPAKPSLEAEPTMVSIKLFQGYKPCSLNLCDVMLCAKVIARIIKRKPTLAKVWIHQRKAHEQPITDGEISTALAFRFKVVRALSFHPDPIINIRLCFTPTLSNDFVKRLAVDIVTWHGLAVDLYCDSGLNEEEQEEMRDDLILGPRVSRFEQAMALGQVVSLRASSRLTSAHSLRSSSRSRTASSPNSHASDSTSQPNSPPPNPSYANSSRPSSKVTSVRVRTSSTNHAAGY